MAATSDITMPLTAAAARPRGKPWTARLFPYFLIAPTLFFVFLFTLWPAAQSLTQSLYTRDPRTADTRFAGIQNYLDLFDETHVIGSQFPRILGNTLIFAFATVFISLPLSLGFALLLNRKIQALGLWRFSIFYPSLLPLIGAASIWAFLYADTIGLINTVLRSFGFSGINWLGDPNVVLISVIIVNIWVQSGFYMLFYLSGLQNIPRDIYEAGALDGASSAQAFFYLTLPLLRRTTLFILVMMFTFAFQTVEQLQVLGQGNPNNRANLLLYFIFQNRSEDLNFGHVYAMTVILTLIVLIFTISNFVFFERGREEH